MLAALKLWAEVEEFFEICASSPGVMPSVIQMEALKKLRLVQLISRGKVGIFGVVFFFFLVFQCPHIFACFVFAYFHVHVFSYSCISMFTHFDVCVFSCFHVFMFSCSCIFMFACFHIHVVSCLAPCLWCNTDDHAPD